MKLNKFFNKKEMEANNLYATDKGNWKNFYLRSTTDENFVQEIVRVARDQFILLADWKNIWKQTQNA